MYSVLEKLAWIPRGFIYQGVALNVAADSIRRGGAVPVCGLGPSMQRLRNESVKRSMTG